MPALQVQHVRQQKRQPQTLRRVQPWVAVGVIAVGQRLRIDRHRAADAISCVLALLGSKPNQALELGQLS